MCFAGLLSAGESFFLFNNPEENNQVVLSSSTKRMSSGRVRIKSGLAVLGCYVNGIPQQPVFLPVLNKTENRPVFIAGAQIPSPYLSSFRERLLQWRLHHSRTRGAAHAECHALQYDQVYPACGGHSYNHGGP